MKITNKHIKKLEKLNIAMQTINTQFQQLMSETQNFNYSSNMNFALNRMNAASDILQSFYDSVIEENSK